MLADLPESVDDDFIKSQRGNLVLQDEEEPLSSGSATVVTWEIEPRGGTCKLTLVHDDFDGETATYKSVGTGWNPVLSGLKTLLETGKPLVIAPSAA
jgi:activator of Hsp90 ATPase-like protein